MAKAKRLAAEVREDGSAGKPARIKLTLNDVEAALLYAILTRISGDPATTWRADSNRILIALGGMFPVKSRIEIIYQMSDNSGGLRAQGKFTLPASFIDHS